MSAKKKTQSKKTKTKSKAKSKKPTAKKKASSTKKALTKKASSAKAAIQKLPTKVTKKGVVAGAVGIAAAAAATVAAFKTFSGASRTVFHVMPHNKGWQITKSGRKGAVQVFDKKRPARDRARTLANENEPSQLVIHREDGTVQAVHTYGE